MLFRTKENPAHSRHNPCDWISALAMALERGRCDDCGAHGRPTAEQINALGPMPHRWAAKRTWFLAHERLALDAALIVVHREPPPWDRGFAGEWNRQENLAVLCSACRSAKRAA